MNLRALVCCRCGGLGVAGRADTVARIALALAQDFEREAAVSVTRDALVLSRIAQAYLLALEELRTSSFYDLELPFLTVNERGPAHLQRRLTAQLLAELARRDPRLAPPLPPQPRPGESSPLATAKKKGWWPFS